MHYLTPARHNPPDGMATNWRLRKTVVMPATRDDMPASRRRERRKRGEGEKGSEVASEREEREREGE